MDKVQLEVEPRQQQGSSVSRVLRREGRVPAIIYSQGKEASQISVSDREFTQTASRALPSQVFCLKSSDKNFDGKDALVREIQLHPISGKVLHIDLQELHEKEEVTLSVPLRVVGEAPGVKIDGGILTVQAREVKVRCIPSAIPSIIDVDVSELRLAQRLAAKDIPLEDNVSLATSPEETIVNIVSGRAAKLAEEEEAAAAADGAGETAEGGEAEKTESEAAEEKKE